MNVTIYSNRQAILSYLKHCLKRFNLSDNEIYALYNSKMQINKNLINMFDELRLENILLYKKTKEVALRFKISAYEKIIKTIKSTNIPILSGDVAKKFDGIGKKNIDKINEFLKYGKVGDVQGVKRNELKEARIYETFKKIWGVGDKTAQEFYKYGYRQISDIPLEILTEQQLIGMKYIDDINTPIPREQITEIYNKLVSLLNIDIIIAGSYRRGTSFSNDIDILVVLNRDAKLSLEMNLEIAHVLQNDPDLQALIPVIGQTKISGIFRRISDPKLYTRFDIHVSPHDERITQLLYFTGSGKFNRDMRSKAKKLGYKLSEKGLFTRIGNLFPIKDEKDIFKKLKIPYLEPKDRL